MPDQFGGIEVPAPDQTSDKFGGMRTTSPKQQPGVFRRAIQPILDIPKDIGEEATAGSQEAGGAIRRAKESVLAGKGYPTGTALDYLTGVLRTGSSPITGTAKGITTALLKNPAFNVTEKVKKAGEDTQFEFLARRANVVPELAQTALEMFGPGAVGKSVEAGATAATGARKAVNILADAGVRLTPGQIMRGIVKSGEDSIRSVPGVGDIIKSGNLRSFGDFDRAVLNRPLALFGEQLPKNVHIGRPAIAWVDDFFGKKYEDLFKKITFTTNNQTELEFRKLQADARTDAGDRQVQLKAYIDDINERVAIHGQLTGPEFQQIDSKLSHDSRKYLAGDPDQEKLGLRLQKVREILRDTLERTNPGYAPQIQKLNLAWAMFERAAGASTRRIKSDGVFSPGDLLADIQKNTTPGSFRRGDGLLQDLADAGNVVLPSDVPDSGTLGRALWAKALGFSLAGGGGAATGVTAPAIAAVGTAMLPYTKPGMSLLRKGYQAVPTSAGIRQSIGRTLEVGGPAAAGATALTDMDFDRWLREAGAAENQQ